MEYGVKIKAVIYSIIWALIVIGTSVISGVVVVISKTDAIHTRYIQAAFAYSAILLQFGYCIYKKIDISQMLTCANGNSKIKDFSCYIICCLVLAVMMVKGIDCSDMSNLVATAVFTLGVGISEELCFRGLILQRLRKSFSIPMAIILSSAIFGAGHMASVFVETSPIMVALNIINAFLFGFLAAESALLSGNIIPLMLFHGLFDFLDYHMLAAGSAQIWVYAIRGTLMCLGSIVLYFKIKGYRL